MAETGIDAVALLWHGRGPRESFVWSALREALPSAVRCIAPDWDSTAPDNGRATLLDSLSEAVDVAESLSVPLVVVGWSLGGTAALSLAHADAALPAPRGVIGLAADVLAPSPLDGLIPADMIRIRGRTILVHGRHDAVVPLQPVVTFAHKHERAVHLTVVDSDHAGVIGTTYDPHARVCRPGYNASAVAGISAAAAALVQTVA